MQPFVRPARIEDAEAMTDLIIAAWENAYRGIMPNEVLDAVDRDLRAKQRRADIERPRDAEIRQWVLEEDGHVCGLAACGPPRGDHPLDDAVYETYALYVDPDRIGQGYGRVLMLHVTDDARARGYREMIVWTLVDNALAARFYEKAGFARDARVEPEEFSDTGCLQLRLRRVL